MPRQLPQGWSQSCKQGDTESEGRGGALGLSLCSRARGQSSTPVGKEEGERGQGVGKSQNTESEAGEHPRNAKWQMHSQLWTASWQGSQA